MAKTNFKKNGNGKKPSDDCRKNNKRKIVA